MPRASIAIAVCTSWALLAANLVGCTDPSPSDKQTADQIRAQARLREREQARAEREANRKEQAESDGESEPNGGTNSAWTEAGFTLVDRGIPGDQGVALALVSDARDGRISQFGRLQSGTAWSTAKVPVAMAALAAGTSSQAQLSGAITASDNASAEALWSGLGSGEAAAQATDRQLALAGDARTRIQARRLRPGFTPFGQTDWSLSNQVRFVAGMASSVEGERILNLMANVVPAQRWGLASIGPRPRFKGGWGPGTTPGQGGPWMERQMGIVEAANGSTYAVAIASEGGDHQTGVSALNRLASYVQRAINKR